MAFLAVFLIFTSCNKDLEEARPIPQPPQETSPTIADKLDDPSFSILKSAIIKAGLMDTLKTPSNRFTLIAPDNDAFIASGLSQAVIDALPAAQVAGLVSYNILPQVLADADIPVSFPNLQYPCIINPAPTVSPFVRLTTFPSKRGTSEWVNNIPIIAPDIVAVNGVIHKVARVVAPPTQFLLERIVADPALLLFKAAIERADQDPTAPGFLQGVLGADPSTAIGANFTVFAPDTTAFKNVLSFLSGGALNPSMPNAVFAGFINTLPIQTVKGMVVYHMLGSRAFSNNLPTVPENFPTLLNSAVPAHPGVTLKATFGPIGVTAATVKGLTNPAASNVLINPTPAPNGTSDQHYVNGTLHRIDQVLLPQ